MSTVSDVDLGRIALLEAIRREGKEWDVIAPRYGVTNPDPPWKTSLDRQCANVSQSTAHFLPWTGAELRMSLQILSMAKCLLQKVSCSHWSIPCSTAGGAQPKILPETALSRRGKGNRARRPAHGASTTATRQIGSF